MRDYEFYYTQDGSIGLYSYTDKDVYHSKFGALTEAWEKFVIPSGIENKLNKLQNIRVLDVCYGIGYNTKALMSYVINQNEEILKEKKLFIIIKNFLKKIFNKIKHIVSIDTNNIYGDKETLLPYNDAIETEKLSNIYIDCLDINEELIKISPLLKTVITPQEIFSRIVPSFFTCLDSYWKIKRFLKKISFKFLPKNKKVIRELLDLKFNNEYEQIDNEYRIHKFVNYILVHELINKYGDKYIDNELVKIIKKRGGNKFFEYSVIKYAQFLQNNGLKLIRRLNLFAFLHNIYYDHLSNRYKKAEFNLLKEIFKVNFYPDDARKTILKLPNQYDLIFLDAFTFSKAPELWTVEFMSELYNRLSVTGYLMTYSNSALVRNTLLENNFYIGKILDKNTGKCIGTIATKEKSLIKHPLSNYELGLCATKAGIPYRDYSLNDSKDVILKRREQEFKNSDLMTSSQYMRVRASKNGENSAK